MKHWLNSMLLVLALIVGVFASDNGKYYKCDEAKLAANNQCIFTLTGEQPDDWLPVEEHNVDRTVGADFYRGVQSYAGLMLSVTPKPWANGDKLVGSTAKIEGDAWSGYTLIFELIAPLRDMMMYHPDLLDADTWALWTRALTDCNVKTVDYVASRGGAQLSTSEVYEVMKNPNYYDVHHNILQYLEEGTIDLVCLSTNMEMSHCDATREASGYVDHRCNCWFDAYEAIYKVCPVVDMEFAHCSNTEAPVVCTGISGDEDEEPEDPATEEPEKFVSRLDLTENYTKGLKLRSKSKSRKKRLASK